LPNYCPTSLSAANHHDSVNIVLDFGLRTINMERCFALSPSAFLS
jgi:hypothetical protein